LKNGKNFTMKILILAGGQGTRLWPLSRKQKPKQFQKLISNKTMLQETAERLFPFFSFKDIFISTNEEYIKEIRTEFPKLPKENIIAEPMSRERVAAIILSIAKLRSEELRKPILVLPSDHSIKKKVEFQKAILAGEKFIKKNPEYIAVLGVKPTFPDTGLGYMKAGKTLKTFNGIKINRLDFFKEKPNLKRTRSYFKDKSYFWNTAIYIFTPSLILKQIRKFVPDNYKRYQRIKKVKFASWRKFPKVIQKEYSEMDKVSLEYTVLENYQNVAVIPVDMGWSDVGSWTVLKDCLSLPNKNFIKGNYIGINSKNVLVYGSFNKLVASIGIKDLIVAVTDDIILICNRKDSQKVRQLVKKLEKQKKFNYI